MEIPAVVKTGPFHALQSNFKTGPKPRWLLLILIFTVTSLPVVAQSPYPVLLPDISLGWSYPNGVELTGGVLVGQGRSIFIGALSLDVRLSYSLDNFATSIGVGAQGFMFIMGAGINAWVSHAFRGNSEEFDSYSVEAFYRFAIVKVKIGNITRFRGDVGSKQTDLVVGVSIGI